MKHTYKSRKVQCFLILCEFVLIVVLYTRVKFLCCLCFKDLESVKQFLLAVTDLGLVMSTVQRFRSEGDVLVVIGKTKVKLPLCRPGQVLEV